MFAHETSTARVWRKLKARSSRRRLLVIWPLTGLLVLLLFAILFDREISLALQNWPPHERAIFGVVTDLGKSDWLLVPALFDMILGATAGRLPLSYSWRWACRALAGLSFYVFATIGISGLIVVVLKRLIGRGRPLHMEEFGAFHFELLPLLDWRLHSFPSGHATTALAFTVVAITVLNGRYKLALILFGLIVGMSRIVVGDHYLSDVVVGSIVGVVAAILIRDFFATRNWSMRLENGHVRFRMLRGFAPLARKLMRGQLPSILK